MAAQVAEELKTVTYGYLSYGGTQKEEEEEEVKTSSADVEDVVSGPAVTPPARKPLL